MGPSELDGTWDYSQLPANVTLGRDCFIESPRLLGGFRSERQPGLVLGDGVRLHLGGWGGMVSVEREGMVTIGADSTLVGVQIMCLRSITIGKRVVISYNAVLADSDFHPAEPDKRRADAISGAPFGTFTGFHPTPHAPVRIEDDVRIGINAIVLKGVTIGAGARVDAGTVVTKDVPAGAVARGNPMTITLGCEPAS